MIDREYPHTAGCAGELIDDGDGGGGSGVGVGGGGREVVVKGGMAPARPSRGNVCHSRPRLTEVDGDLP